jgi:hypothetical protein
MLATGRKRGFSLSGGLKGASGQYLTWFYGIRSLMFDVEGTLEALHKKASERHTARAKETLLAERVQDNLVLHQGATLSDSRYRRTQKDELVIRAGLTGQFDAGVLESFGFRLSDVPSSVWEIVPWSFIVDWFVNVGDYIQALSVDSVTGVRGQWITTTRTCYLERKVTSVTVAPGSGGWTWSKTRGCSDRDFGTYTTTSRELVNLASEIGLQFRSNLNRVPVLAALALVTQQLTRR